MFVKTSQGPAVLSDDDEDEGTREEMLRWRAMKHEEEEVSVSARDARESDSASAELAQSTRQIDAAPIPHDDVRDARRKLPRFRRITEVETPTTPVQSNAPIDTPVADGVATPPESRDPPPMSGAAIDSASAVRASSVPTVRTERVIGDVGASWASRVFRPPPDADDKKDLKPRGGKHTLH